MPIGERLTIDQAPINKIKDGALVHATPFTSIFDHNRGLVVKNTSEGGMFFAPSGSSRFASYTATGKTGPHKGYGILLDDEVIKDTVSSDKWWKRQGEIERVVPDDAVIPKVGQYLQAHSVPDMGGQPYNVVTLGGKLSALDIAKLKAQGILSAAQDLTPGGLRSKGWRIEDGPPVKPVDVSVKPVDVPGRPVDVPGRPVDASGRPVDASGRPVDADGRPVGPDGRPVDADGRPVGPDGRPVGPDGRPVGPDGRRRGFDDGEVHGSGREIRTMATFSTEPRRAVPRLQVGNWLSPEPTSGSSFPGSTPESRFLEPTPESRFLRSLPNRLTGLSGSLFSPRTGLSESLFNPRTGLSESLFSPRTG